MPPYLTSLRCRVAQAALPLKYTPSLCRLPTPPSSAAAIHAEMPRCYLALAATIAVRLAERRAVIASPLASFGSGEFPSLS